MVEEGMIDMIRAVMIRSRHTVVAAVVCHSRG